MLNQNRVTQQETIDAILDASSRTSGSVPLRNLFVQGRDDRGRARPGVLAEMLRRHDERALDLYLLHRAGASAEPWDTTRDARVWARAIGLGDRAADAAEVSKIWRRLAETYRAVQRERRGRLAKITTLKEDGSGATYTYPNGRGSDRYFKIPFAYWKDGWHRQLNLREKAVLLVAMSMGPKEFVLPIERVPDWYGISADSAQRALSELRRHRLLHFREVAKRAPLAPAGMALERRYTLQAPFVPVPDRRRRRLRAVA